MAAAAACRGVGFGVPAPLSGLPELPRPAGGGGRAGPACRLTPREGARCRGRRGAEQPGPVPGRLGPAAGSGQTGPERCPLGKFPHYRCQLTEGTNDPSPLRPDGKVRRGGVPVPVSSAVNPSTLPAPRWDFWRARPRPLTLLNFH